MTATVLTGKGIKFAQLAAAKAAIKLEKLGLRHSRIGSVRRLWAIHMGLRPTARHDQVIEQIEREMREIEDQARAVSE